MEAFNVIQQNKAAYKNAYSNGRVVVSYKEIDGSMFVINEVFVTEHGTSNEFCAHKEQLPLPGDWTKEKINTELDEAITKINDDAAAMVVELEGLKLA